MTDKHIALVFNPVSGQGKSKRKVLQLEQLFVERGCSIQRIESSPDQRILANACAGINPDARFIVVGGDGTLNLFLNAVDTGRPVAFYGTGTANVMRHQFDLPTDDQQFVDMVLAGHIIPLRLGLVDGKHFFCMMWSCGIDAHILRHISQSAKNRIGKAAFVLAGLRAMLTYQWPHFTLMTDQDRQTEVTFAIVSKIRMYAGPHCVFDTSPRPDGLQVLTFRGHSRRSLLRLVWDLLWGKLDRNPNVTRSTHRQVRVTHRCKNLYNQIDGDFSSDLASTICVSDRTISFVVPADPR